MTKTSIVNAGKSLKNPMTTTAKQVQIEILLHLFIEFHFSSPFFFRGWLMLPKKTNGGREEGKSQGGETQKFDDDENKVASKA